MQKQIANHKAKKSPRKVYSAPRLMYYGHVTTLTAGGGGTMGDGGGAMSMGCWIAEVLYGIDAPRTRLVRSWLTEAYKRGELIARIAVPIYSRFGVAVAGLLRKRPVLQWVFRPLFDQAVRHAHREYAARVLLLQT